MINSMSKGPDNGSYQVDADPGHTSTPGREQTEWINQELRSEILETGVAPWTGLIAFFINTIDNDNTRRVYLRHIIAFRQQLRLSDVQEIELNHIEGYREWLLRRGPGHPSHTQALAAVRAFLQWVGAVIPKPRFTRESVWSILKDPERGMIGITPRLLNDKELGKLNDAARSPRDHAILALMLDAGLRASELLALDTGSVQDDGYGGGRIQTGPLQDQRKPVIRAPEGVIRAIRGYLESEGRRLDQPGPLFTAFDRGRQCRLNKRMGMRALRNTIRSISALAGVEVELALSDLYRAFTVRAQKRRRKG